LILHPGKIIRSEEMTMKKKLGMEALLLAILLVSMVFVPAVSAQEKATEKELTFGPGTFKELKSDPDFIAAYGSIPSLGSLEERKKWIISLDKIYVKVKDNHKTKMSKLFYPTGPVIGYGYTDKGVLEVVIEKRQKIDTLKEKELYSIFSNYGQEVKVSNIPLVFVYEDLPVPTSRISSWRPLIGGIQINTEQPAGVAQSTLGFAAKDSRGNKGYVVAAHAAPSIGDQIWQPIAGPSANKVGKVTKASKYQADASWVPYANVKATIYDYDIDVTRNVISYADPFVGEYVYKSGVVTGRTYGSVTKKRTIYHPGLERKLDNQYIAEYKCDFGDSGSPVYDYVPDGVKIVGIHWGGIGTYVSGFGDSVLSPVSGVKSDLGVTPLTA
jgi:hypothetical protein